MIIPRKTRPFLLGLALVAIFSTQPSGQVTCDPASEVQKRPKLTAADIDDLATLLRLEDTRQFDEAALRRIMQSANPDVRRRAVVSIGRIISPKGSALVEIARKDPDVQVVASAAFAAGQLKDATAVTWLDALLAASSTPADVAREAAQALGKIRTPEARASLTRSLDSATSSPSRDAAIGEALLSLGRFPAGGDLEPITRWMTSRNDEFRWRATWALFRPRDPKSAPHLLKLTDDASPDVRFWAVRGLTPALVDQAGLDRKTVTARLLAGTTDRDRRVRTESLRALLQYDDDTAFGALLTGLASPDAWIAISAAESAGRFSSRAAELRPRLVAAATASKSMWFLQVAVGPLTALAPETAVEAASRLARSGAGVFRSTAVQALGRLGGPGEARLAELQADPALKGLLPAPGGRGGNAGGAPRPTPVPRTEADYRRLVEKWIVPAYEGTTNPRAIWETPRGRIELELNGGDAPLGAEYFVQSISSGDIVGTEFSRVVPNFVDQQQRIRNAPILRDEVNRHGLNRGTLAWASSGLDTGPPGFTLGSTPQPHNEGDFTALGRVVSGMDVVDRIEQGDKILAARMK